MADAVVEIQSTDFSDLIDTPVPAPEQVLEPVPVEVTETPAEAVGGKDATVSEISRLLPESQEFQLSSGVAVRIERLRTREFLKLLKILTRGAGTMLMEYRLDGDLGSDEFMAKLVALIGLSIPEAENETVDFLRAMTVPIDVKPGNMKSLSKEDQDHNERIWADYEEAMLNPELDDLVNIVELVVRAESGDMQRLGKRIAAMMQLAAKTGQI